MRRRQICKGAAASIAMLVLILDSKTILQGAGEGIELCLKTVFPSLFPFFILSTILTSTLMGDSLLWLRPLGRLFGLPTGAEALLITGFLGGYPIGAQAVGDAWRFGQISQKDAQRLLLFCNNAGPAFIFGMIGPLFPNPRCALLLWGIHIFSATLVSQIIPQQDNTPIVIKPQAGLSFQDTMNTAMRAIASVCGWVIFFRVIISVLQKWVLWLLPITWQVILIGMIELSNGCTALFSIESVPLRFSICSGMIAFGGLCVAMQTSSVIHGLQLKYHFLGKSLQAVFSILISSAFVAGIGIPCILLLILAMAILGIKQKKSSIHTTVGV